MMDRLAKRHLFLSSILREVFIDMIHWFYKIESGMFP